MTFSDAVFLGALRVKETISMKCQSLFSEKNTKNILNLSSAEFSQGDG